MPTNKKRRAPMWARLCVIFGAVLTILPASALVGAYAIADRYDRNIARSNDLLPPGQPSHAPVTGPLNILVIGVDNSGNDRSYQGVYGSRADTIILFHLPKSMDRGYAVSFPRDSYVNIPPQKGKWDGGKNKINAAVAYGGPQLLVKTIQNLSGLTIDHVVIVDFKALHTVTDAVGGVDVYVEKTVIDGRTKYKFPAGWNHLDGKLAEVYLRQRYGLAEGDFDRVKRQQQYLHALLKKATDTGVLTNPAKLDALLTAGTASIQVDSGLPVKDLAFQLRAIRPSAVKFVTLPFAGYVRSEFGVANRVDTDKARQLFAAVKTETVDAYLKKYPPNDVTKGR